ncbi:MAG: hypothetical protein IMF09_04110 [Proteobacteria bacterium]|nr:hypothetical protein [Pseudomonadota bacterium]
MIKRKVLILSTLLSFALCIGSAWAGNLATDEYTGGGTVVNGVPPNINSVTLMMAPMGNILYDNGPLINSPGTGAGGADESILETITLGLNIFGYGHQVAADNRIADDFTINSPGGWLISNITFYAYQTSSSITSTMTAANLRIWDGIPGEVGSQVVWGDDSTNIMTATGWSGIYRVTETTSGDTLRPIMTNEVAVNTVLIPGTYWLDWQTDGTLISGPWAPPISILGQAVTGNGMQSVDGGVTYAAVVDSGTADPAGFPFIIAGNLNGFGAPKTIPLLANEMLLLLAALLALVALVTIRRKMA